MLIRNASFENKNKKKSYVTREEDFLFLNLSKLEELIIKVDVNFFYELSSKNENLNSSRRENHHRKFSRQ